MPSRPNAPCLPVRQSKGPFREIDSVASGHVIARGGQTPIGVRFGLDSGTQPRDVPRAEKVSALKATSHQTFPKRQEVGNTKPSNRQSVYFNRHNPVDIMSCVTRTDKGDPDELDKPKGCCDGCSCDCSFTGPCTKDSQLCCQDCTCGCTCGTSRRGSSQDRDNKRRDRD